MSKKEENLSFGNIIGSILLVVSIVWFINAHITEPNTEKFDNDWKNYEEQSKKIADELEQEQKACEQKYGMYDTRLVDCLEQAGKNRDMKSRNLKTPMP